MENFILDQIKPTLRTLPAAVLRSYRSSERNADVDRFLQKTGFIKGICHPSESFSKLKEANLEWIRVDIPFPFEQGEKLRKAYTDFKSRIKRFADAGLKVMAVTPYPEDYINYGLDPRKEESTAGIEQLARFLLQDLRELVHGIQITNEQGIPRFTLPLTLEESARFIGITARAMSTVKGDIPIGYNTAGPQADLQILMKPYLPYFDYVGIDIYMGCFFFGTMWMFEVLIRYVREITHKPVILCEFGYISDGAPKSAKRKREIVRSYGASSKAAAKRNIVPFVEAMPPRMRDYVKKCARQPSRYWSYIFHSEFTNHFYKELSFATVIPGYPHTPNGQARFYSDIIRRLRKLDFLCGMFVYCWSDSDRCYVCSQEDCPTETRWGLVDCNENEKPSYYAVKEAFNDENCKQ